MSNKLTAYDRMIAAGIIGLCVAFSIPVINSFVASPVAVAARSKQPLPRPHLGPNSMPAHK